MSRIRSSQLSGDLNLAAQLVCDDSLFSRTFLLILVLPLCSHNDSLWMAYFIAFNAEPALNHFSLLIGVVRVLSFELFFAATFVLDNNF